MSTKTIKSIFFVSCLMALVILGPTSALAQSEVNVHKIPKYPVIVDDVRYAPEEITRFNGQPLVMFANEQVEKEGVIRAFTTEEKAQEFVSSLKMMALDINAIPRSQLGITLVFKDINYGNKIDDGSCGEAWNLTGSDDNAASSVITAHCSSGSYTKLYDNYNLSGSSLWITTGFDPDDLRDYGWNDRASSYEVES